MVIFTAQKYFLESAFLLSRTDGICWVSLRNCGNRIIWSQKNNQQQNAGNLQQFFTISMASENQKNILKEGIF